MEPLNDIQLHALELREKAIKRVTTKMGRTFASALALPSYVSRGFYLPAPMLPRFLQITPENSDSNSGWFSVSQGIDFSVTGMTVIAQHLDYCGPPHMQIIFDFPSRDENVVRFYDNNRKRLDPSSLEADFCVSALSFALDQ